MAHHQLKHMREAKEALDRADQLYLSLQRSDRVLPEGYVHDWLICRILRREGDSLTLIKRY